MSDQVKQCNSAAERRQQLLESMLECVKKCQVRFGGKVELATDSSPEVTNLCTRLELTLQHGMKGEGRDQSLGMAVIRNVKDLVSNKTDSGQCVWKVVRTIVNKHEYERYLLLDKVTTDTGRGRAWIRSVLNEQSLERYLHLLLGDEIMLGEFYEEWAFLRDQERASMLPSMAAGLASIRFALKVDNSSLNGDDGGESSILSPTFATSFFPTLKNQMTSHQNPSVAAEVAPDQVIDTSRVRTKRKKKHKPPPAQIVSFDDDLASPRLQESGGCVAVSESAPPTCGLKPETDQSSSSPSSSIDRGLVREEGGDKFSFNYAPATLAREEDEMDIYPGTGTSFTEESRPPSQLGALTPVTNKGVGALFPVSRLGPDEAANSGEDSSVSPNPSVGQGDEDYATTSRVSRLDVKVAGGGRSVMDDVGSVSATSVHSFESCRSNSSLGRGDLKQALLSVIEKKDELEVQNKSLKSLLDQEMKQAGEARQEAEEVRLKLSEQLEKMEGRNGIMARENELLKHQLKKYVGAVQKLRDGPQAYETLARLEGAKGEQEGGSSKYIDYHFEASEYEKKLIQVAEMHGELLEFNENLQKTVQTKDGIIARLKEDLISLRGPLPEEDGGDTDSLCSSYTESVASVGGRVLVNIWIPSVFLTGSGSARHHVYQVYVRIRDTEWNVYRRYSQFFQLHQSLRKKDPIVNSFDFPPKKSVGNKAERFVEDRRRALQSYLRSIVNYLATTNVVMSSSPDKETLLDLLPFFGDQQPTRGSAGQEGSTLSLFSRRRTSNQGVANHLVL